MNREMTRRLFVAGLLVALAGTAGATTRDIANLESVRLMQDILTGYRQGDSACQTIFDQFIDDFGRCIGGLISILDPDAVVLGGGLSNIDALYSSGIDKARIYAFHEQIETPILRNRLGDSAGVFGAAWIGV